MAEADPIVRLENVYKIFGVQPGGRALELAKSGMSKNDVQAATRHVVGMTDVSLEINRGETFVIMGLSGSGKSTAIRTINQLHGITDGHVWVDGVDVATLRGKALQKFRRDKMGMVFQHFALFPHRTVIENTGYGLKVQGVPKAERDRRSIEALDLVGLASFAQSYPHELSGGMQQRVGLTRALAADPDILLMDEAFSALDPLIRRQMQDEMMDIQSKLHKTIIFITHDLNEALRIGDRICIMKDGAVVQIGTPEEILTQPATGYVAEFVQDVDQGRVIEVQTIMNEPAIVAKEMSIADAVDTIGHRSGGYTVSSAGEPLALFDPGDAALALAQGNSDINDVLRTDFDTATKELTFNHVYHYAGRGLTIAVVDDVGKLIGTLSPREMMEEMGRVERLIDGFEREVFM